MHIGSSLELTHGSSKITICNFEKSQHTVNFHKIVFHIIYFSWKRMVLHYSLQQYFKPNVLSTKQSAWCDEFRRDNTCYATNMAQQIIVIILIHIRIVVILKAGAILCMILSQELHTPQFEFEVLPTLHHWKSWVISPQQERYLILTDRQPSRVQQEVKRFCKVTDWRMQSQLIRT